MERKNSANLLVRESITQALFNLMEKRDFRSISVSELVKTAGVSRNSFYRNYESLEDIIRQFLMERTSLWWENYMAHLHTCVVAEIFRLLKSMEREIKLIYKAGRYYLLMDLFDFCGKVGQPEGKSITYHNAFTVGGLWGLANEWIKQGMQETPEETEAMFPAKNLERKNVDNIDGGSAADVALLPPYCPNVHGPHHCDLMAVPFVGIVKPVKIGRAHV